MYLSLSVVTVTVTHFSVSRSQLYSLCPPRSATLICPRKPALFCLFRAIRNRYRTSCWPASHFMKQTKKVSAVPKVNFTGYQSSEINKFLFQRRRSFINLPYFAKGGEFRLTGRCISGSCFANNRFDTIQWCKNKNARNNNSSRIIRLFTQILFLDGK